MNSEMNVVIYIIILSLYYSYNEQQRFDFVCQAPCVEDQVMFNPWKALLNRLQAGLTEKKRQLGKGNMQSFCCGVAGTDQPCARLHQGSRSGKVSLGNLGEKSKLRQVGKVTPTPGVGLVQIDGQYNQLFIWYFSSWWTSQA